ncbi:MAG: galactokinase [Chitinophagaceae bacterium]|nr:galactokinase [Chitinophagaceae bacterium]
MEINAAAVAAAYRQQFGSAPAVLAAAPGRINLIGEHIDYNHGWVMPAAIHQCIWVAAGPAPHAAADELHIWSVAHQQLYTASLAAPLVPHAWQWPNYVLGVLQQLQRHGHALRGLQLCIGGNVPVGAGVSSSAALECAALTALNELWQLALPPLRIVQLAQAAENQFVGVNCGIMDQYASVFGRQGQCLLLDCDALTHTYLPLPPADYQLLLLDTQVKHSLAGSAYNDRRAACEQGLAVLQQQYAGTVRTWREVSGQQLEAVRPLLAPATWQRCSYVVAELQRVQAAVEALQQGQWWQFGQLLYQTHQGLSQVYQVSCPELDNIVATCTSLPAVLGARMMGGGFGGCVLALVQAAQASQVYAAVAQAYELAFGRAPVCLPVQTGPGAHIVLPGGAGASLA